MRTTAMMTAAAAAAAARVTDGGRRGRLRRPWRRAKLGWAIAAAVGGMAWGWESAAQSFVSYQGGEYLQNFDGLPNGGNIQADSPGPMDLMAAPFNATNLDGWSIQNYKSGGTGARLNVSNGGNNSGGTYSLGASGSTERALGSVSSSAYASRYGVVLRNDTGSTLTSFTLSYWGEQWREANSAAQSLQFGYQVGGTDIATGTFLSVAALDFTGPAPSSATDKAIDGNAAQNRALRTATVGGLTWAPGDTLVLRWVDIDDTGDDDGLAIDDLIFFAEGGVVLPANLTWSASAGRDWSASPAACNWMKDGAPPAVAFAHGDLVTFGDEAVGSVFVDAAGVSPGSTTFANAAGAYNVSGGAIGGTGTLTKTGAGTAVLLADNTYSGGTFLNGGTLAIMSDAGLGDAAGPVSFDGGTLRADAPITSARTLTLVSTGTVNTQAFDVTVGGTTGAGSLVKTGSGRLILAGAPAHDGTTSILGGTLVLGQPSGTVTLRADDSGTALTGNLELANAIRVNLAGGSFGGSDGSAGEVRTFASGSTIAASASGPSTSTIGGVVRLNAGDAAGDFVTHFTANAEDTLVFDGSITGASDVIFGLPSGLVGAGTIVVNAAATYSGATVITLAHAAAQGDVPGVLRLGVNDALPPGTALTFGNETNDSGALDLAGHDQSIASLASAPGRATNGITNTGATTATLTITGSASTTYAGPIGAVYHDLGAAAAGNDAIALVLAPSHAGRLRLAGNTTYVGGTAVHGGTLVVANGAAATGPATGYGPVVVSGGGTLAGDGRVGGAVSVADGGAIEPGDDGAGVLVLDGGLDLSGGGVYRWGLAGLGSAMPGVQFDQLRVTGGAIVLGGTSKVAITFDAGVPDPASGDAFWAGSNSWRLIDATGSAYLEGALPELVGGTFAAGTFALRAGTGPDAGDLFLDYIVAAAGPRNLVWDGGGAATPGAQDVDGTWTDAGLWLDLTTNTTFDSAVPDNAVFGSGGGMGLPVTVTIPSPVTAGQVTFAGNSPSYILAGVGAGTLTLAGTAEVDLTADNSATITAPVILGGPQTWAINGTDVTLTVGGAITGEQPLVKTGTGMLALSNPGNAFASLTIAGGTVFADADEPLGAPGAPLIFGGDEPGDALPTLSAAASFTTARPITVNAGGGAVETSGSDLTFSGAIDGRGTLTKTGFGTLTLTGANSVGGLAIVGAGSVLAVNADAALGSGTVTLSDGGALRVPDGFSTGRTIALEGADVGGVVEIMTGSATFASFSGERLTKAGAGRMVVEGAPAGRTGLTVVEFGALRIAATDGEGVSGLGSGAVRLLFGATLEVAATPGYRPDGGRGTGFELEVQDGAAVVGVGPAAAMAGTLSFAHAGSTALRAPSATDRLKLGSTVRRLTGPGSGAQPIGVISVEGEGVVHLASGATSPSSDTQFDGQWLVKMGPTGIFSVGPADPGGLGETLNALGYATGNPRGAGAAVTVESGTLAIGSDRWNAGSAEAIAGVVSIRSPITLAGGRIASTGLTLDTAASAGAGGAVFGAEPVAANLAGDLTVAAGKTSAVLLYDLVAGGARDVNVMTDPAAENVAGNLSWAGLLVLESEPGTGAAGALNLTRDLAATSGTVTVTPGAQITVKAGATLNLGGPGGTLVDSATPANAVNIVNDAADEGKGLHVTGGAHVVGTIGGDGRTTVTGGTLAANHVRQASLAIADGGHVTIRPDGTSAGASKVGSLTMAGSATLDLTDNDLVVGTTTAEAIRGLIRAGMDAGDGVGGIMTSLTTVPESYPSTVAGKRASLGYAAGDDPAVAHLGGSLGGQDFGPDDVLVKYTLEGDANLDGDVDLLDVLVWGPNFTGELGGLGTKTWTQGDWDYDGDVDLLDVLKWGPNFTGELGGGGLSIDVPAPLHPAAAAWYESVGIKVNVVPEPGSLGALAVAACGLLGRRRRRRG